MDIYKFFFRNNSSPLPHKDITAFEGTPSNVCFLPHNPPSPLHIYPAWFSNYSGFKKHLNTPQNNSASWDLQIGFNSGFKGLMDGREEPATY